MRIREEARTKTDLSVDMGRAKTNQKNRSNTPTKPENGIDTYDERGESRADQMERGTRIHTAATATIHPAGLGPEEYQDTHCGRHRLPRQVQ